MLDLRYPIGPYEPTPPVDDEQRFEFLSQLADAPHRLRTAVHDLSGQQLDTPYRPGGWTIRQVVHHLADSHLNWYVRTRLALTEDGPAIKPYDEARWAQLSDARQAPIELSLVLLESLHARWVLLLKSLAPEDWNRNLFHPERGVMTLNEVLPMLAWHGRHHVAHITELRGRMAW